MRVVAFQNYEELVSIKQSLKTNPKLAINRITAWQSRQVLPPSISSTLNLISSENILDKSMAIVIFVNSTIDQLQSKSYAQSIASLASTINLPLWLVDLRHAATHNQLPTLKILDAACDCALDWLICNFWDLQSEPEPLVEVNFHEYLTRYKSLRIKEIKNDLNHDFSTCKLIPRSRILEFINNLLSFSSFTKKSTKSTPSSTQLKLWNPLFTWISRYIKEFTDLLFTRMCEIELFENCWLRYFMKMVSIKCFLNAFSLIPNQFIDDGIKDYINRIGASIFLKFKNNVDDSDCQVDIDVTESRILHVHSLLKKVHATGKWSNGDYCDAIGDSSDLNLDWIDLGRQDQEEQEIIKQPSKKIKLLR